MGTELMNTLQKFCNELSEKPHQDVRRILPKLQMKGIITSAEKEIIEGKHTGQERLASLYLDILPTKDENICVDLLRILKKSGNTEAATLLEHIMNELQAAQPNVLNYDVGVINSVKESLIKFFLGSYFTSIQPLPGHHFRYDIDKLWVNLVVTDQKKMGREVKRRDWIKALQDGLSTGLPVLVTGEPGIGKSTLIKRICFEWASGSFREYDLVLPARLREVTKAESILDIPFQWLKQMFRTGLEEWEQAERLCKEAVSSKQPKVLIMLDGLDENICECSELVELLASSSPFVVNYHLLITTRPMSEKPTNCRVFSIYGLEEDQQREYVKRHFEQVHEAKPDTIATIEEKLKSDESWKDLARIPLMLSYLCIIGGNLTSSHLTDLYEALVVYLIKRREIEIRRGKRLFKENFKTDNSILTLSELALKGLLEEPERLIFAESEIEEPIKRKIYVDVGFLVRDPIVRLDDDPKNMYFPHKSIQEFFAAIALLHEMGSESSLWRRIMSFLGKTPESTIWQQLEKRKWEMKRVVAFLIGLTGTEHEQYLITLIQRNSLLTPSSEYDDRFGESDYVRECKTPYLSQKVAQLQMDNSKIINYRGSGQRIPQLCVRIQKSGEAINQLNFTITDTLYQHSNSHDDPGIPVDCLRLDFQYHKATEDEYSRLNSLFKYIHCKELRLWNLDSLMMRDVDVGVVISVIQGITSLEKLLLGDNTNNSNNLITYWREEVSQMARGKGIELEIRNNYNEIYYHGNGRLIPQLCARLQESCKEIKTFIFSVTAPLYRHTNSHSDQRIQIETFTISSPLASISEADIPALVSLLSFVQCKTLKLLNEQITCSTNHEFKESSILDFAREFKNEELSHQVAEMQMKLLEIEKEGYYKDRIDYRGSGRFVPEMCSELRLRGNSHQVSMHFFITDTLYQHSNSYGDPGIPVKELKLTFEYYRDAKEEELPAFLSLFRYIQFKKLQLQFLNGSGVKEFFTSIIDALSNSSSPCEEIVFWHVWLDEEENFGSLENVRNKLPQLRTLIWECSDISEKSKEKLREMTRMNEIELEIWNNDNEIYYQGNGRLFPQLCARVRQYGREVDKLCLTITDNLDEHSNHPGNLEIEVATFTINSSHAFIPEAEIPAFLSLLSFIRCREQRLVHLNAELSLSTDNTFDESSVLNYVRQLGKECLLHQVVYMQMKLLNIKKWITYYGSGRFVSQMCSELRERGNSHQVNVSFVVTDRPYKHSNSHGYPGIPVDWLAVNFQYHRDVTEDDLSAFLSLFCYIRCKKLRIVNLNASEVKEYFPSLIDALSNSSSPCEEILFEWVSLHEEEKFRSLKNTRNKLPHLRKLEWDGEISEKSREDLKEMTKKNGIELFLNGKFKR